MKKLNLLKPDYRTGYLNNGKGEEVNYLQLNPEMGMDSLEQDVKNGAEQYRELLEFSKKKLSQFVVINCTNKEEGLMAVTYLANIYNEREQVEDYMDEYDISDEENLEFEDYIMDEDEEDEWENQSSWEENPGRIPVISSQQLCYYQGNIFPSFRGPMGFGTTANTKSNIPYWHYVRKEAICIVREDEFGFLDLHNIISELKRYKKNRHVYFVVVNNWEKEIEGEVYSDEEESEFDLCELVLEYAAGTIDITTDTEHRKKYYETLFDNWIKEKSYSLEKGFPKAKIVNKITSFHNPSKAEIMEKVINYVAKDIEEPRALSEKDFQVINKFRMLRFENDEKEHQATKKLKNSLVGLDSVKEQVYGIVEIMKYNKRRREMGLGSNNYHNVHLLLGAPGTAKTTVAQLLGEIMAEERLIGTNRFISVNGAELKGMYVGHSAPKVKALFDDYDVILIDEAYSLTVENHGETDSFSQEAISQLLIELEKHGMDKLVMFAGYGGKHVNEKDNKMKQFLKANPGIQSRINSTIYFDSYTPDQMADIFLYHAKNSKFSLEKEAREMVKEYFSERVLEPDFGNGREARSLLENTTMEAAKRIAKIPENKRTKKNYQLLSREDIKKAIEKQKESFLMQKGMEKEKCGFAV